MKQALTLSIIIPVYNEQDYLKHCLDSIAAQTDAPDEVLVIDNNSTDNTVAVAKGYPFATILTAKKQGVVYARDVGFNAAKSMLIGRIDADTQLGPNWVSAVKKIMQDSSIAAATGPVAYFDMPKPEINYWIDHQIRSRLFHHAPEAPFLFGTNMVISKMAWEAVAKDVCHRSDIHEDIDLAIHLDRKDFRISYETSMLASMSARRWDDPPAQFRKYMKVLRESWRVHDIVSIAPRIATSIYMLGYWLGRHARGAYDVETNTRSLKRYITHKKPSARKHPMGD